MSAQETRLSEDYQDEWMHVVDVPETAKGSRRETIAIFGFHAATSKEFFEKYFIKSYPWKVTKDGIAIAEYEYKNFYVVANPEQYSTKHLKETIQAMHERYSAFKKIILVFSANQTRLTSDDGDFLKSLWTILGPSMWDKSILVILDAETILRGKSPDHILKDEDHVGLAELADKMNGIVFMPQTDGQGEELEQQKHQLWKNIYSPIEERTHVLENIQWGLYYLLSLFTEAFSFK